jgi:hypothetical protein
MFLKFLLKMKLNLRQKNLMTKEYRFKHSKRIEGLCLI